MKIVKYSALLLVCIDFRSFPLQPIDGYENSSFFVVNHYLVLSKVPLKW